MGLNPKSKRFNRQRRFLKWFFVFVFLLSVVPQREVRGEIPHGRVNGAYTHLFSNEGSDFLLGGKPEEDFGSFDFFFKWDQKVLKEKGRFYFSSYAYVDTTQRGSLDLIEAFFDFQISEATYAVVGQKKEVWGNGITWNPGNLMVTEALYDTKLQRDRPLDAQKGRLMAKMGILFRGGSLDFFFLPLLIDKEGDYSRGLDMALKLNLLLSRMEFNIAGIQTMSGSERGTKKSAISSWASYALPNNLTFFGDGLVSFHNRFSYPLNDSLDENVPRREDIVFSWLAGANYRLPQEIVLRLEYFHNGYGYSSQQRKGYFTGLEKQAQTSNFTSFRQWSSFYELYLLSRDFVGWSFLKDNLLRKVDCRFQFIYGPEDHGFITESSLSYHLIDSIDIHLNARYQWGEKPFSEFFQQITRAKVWGGATWHL